MVTATQKRFYESKPPSGVSRGRDNSLYTSYRGSKAARKQAKRACGSNVYNAEDELRIALQQLSSPSSNRNDINTYGASGSRTMNQTRGMLNK